MPENKAIKAQRQFMVGWSVLNLLGWVIGICFVFLIQSNLEYTNKYSAWKTMLVWIPLGASIGAFQWLMLKRIGINFFVWVIATALGCSLVVTLYSWVLNFGSFEYRMKYSIPYPIVNVGLAITLPVGGAIIGGLQSIAIRRHISRFDLWIRAYVFGLLLPPIIAPLSILVKSFFLNLLYSTGIYMLVDLRRLIFFGLLTIITTIFISILTGNILLKQSDINSVTITAS